MKDKEGSLVHIIVSNTKNVSKFNFSSKMSKMSYLFANISGPDSYFSKPIFALKPWVQAGRFGYQESFNQKNFFRTYKGVLEYFFRTYKGVLEFKKVKNTAARVVQMKI